MQYSYISDLFSQDELSEVINLAKVSLGEEDIENIEVLTNVQIFDLMKEKLKKNLYVSFIFEKNYAY